MGLFGNKKEKPRPVCPICGAEIKFFSSSIIADGTICDECVESIRPLYEKEVVCSKIRDSVTGQVSYDFSGQYHSTNRFQFASNRERDPILDLTVDEVKEAQQILEAYNKWVHDEYDGAEPDHSKESSPENNDVAGKVTAIMKIRDSELLMLRPLDVGLKRAKLLKGKTCARGYVGEGEFAKGDRAILISGGKEHEIELIDVYKGSLHDTTAHLIAAGMQKNIASKGDLAYLIFDGGEALAMAEDLIIKR